MYEKAHSPPSVGFSMSMNEVITWNVDQIRILDLPSFLYSKDFDIFIFGRKLLNVFQFTLNTLSV